MNYILLRVEIYEYSGYLTWYETSFYYRVNVIFAYTVLCGLYPSFVQFFPSFESRCLDDVFRIGGIRVD